MYHDRQPDALARFRGVVLVLLLGIPQVAAQAPKTGTGHGARHRSQGVGELRLRSRQPGDLLHRLLRGSGRQFPQAAGIQDPGTWKSPSWTASAFSGSPAPSASASRCPKCLPAKFTIEIDVINRKSLDGAGFPVQGTLLFTNDVKPSSIVWGQRRWGLSGGGGGGAPRLQPCARTRAIAASRHSCASWATASTSRPSSTRSASSTSRTPIRPHQGPQSWPRGAATRTRSTSARIRIAARDKTIYDELSAKGRVATQGILFDIGSDRIKPESTPTLKEIGAMLHAHPELKLSVEGHTDNVGDAGGQPEAERGAGRRGEGGAGEGLRGRCARLRPRVRQHQAGRAQYHAEAGRTTGGWIW